jgi:hypothetical protein
MLNVEDRLAIQELIARYCWALDTDKSDDYAATFIPTGILHGGPRRYEGHDQLREFVLTRRPGALASQHWTTNLVIDGDGESATGRCYMVGPRSDSTGISIALMGYYKDSFVKTDSNWYFVEREFVRWSPIQNTG